MSLRPLTGLDGEILDGGWYVHLRRARCDDEIVDSVREFLASLTTQEVARLPIRSLEITTPSDIPRLSSLLARSFEALSPASPDREIYIRTIAMLCYATDRLSQLPETAVSVHGVFL